MSRKGDHSGGNVKATLLESLVQNNATAWRRVSNNNAEELLWIAEVMAGSRQAGEKSLAAAIELAAVAQYVGEEWILSWVKRLLVQVALAKISAEIREWLPSPSSRLPAKLVKLGLSESERRQVRAISPQEIIASCDVLERACFVLSAYLRYSLLDCALLLGVPRDWIEPICERAFMKILDVALSAKEQLGEIASFVSQGGVGCQAD
jgi:DNA-directed RNA polymerase specialized sigma24 family protein